MRTTVILAGFFDPVESKLKTHFSRIYREGLVVWIPDVDRGRYGVRVPEVDRYSSAVATAVKGGCQRVITMVSDPYGHGAAQLIERANQSLHEESSGVRFSIIEEASPLSYDAVENKIVETHGAACTDPLIRDADLESLLFGRKILCVSSTQDTSFKAVLAEGAVPALGDVLVEQRISGSANDNARWLGRGASEFGRLLFASGRRLGVPPRYALDPWAQRAHVAIRPVDALLSFLVEVHGQTEQRAVREAALVQELLLRADLEHIPNLEISAIWRPAYTVSGDYYDVFNIAGGTKVAFVIADISGKGLPAAFRMAEIRGAIRTVAQQNIGPVGVLGQVHDGFRSVNGEYLTCFYCEYDRISRQLTYANAGHLAPILARADRDAPIPLDSAGVPMGLPLPFTACGGHLEVRPGDLLVLYTDGFTDAVELAPEQAEAQKIADIVMAHRNASSEEVKAALLEGFRQSRFEDDATALIIRIS